MPDQNTNERLASLEAKLEFVKELLKEIRDDVKNQPSREEYEEMKERVSKLEDAYKGLIWKIASASGAISVLISVAVKLLS